MRPTSWLAYAAMRTALQSTRLLPLNASAAVAGGLMRAFYHLAPRRRRITLENIQRALDTDDLETRRIAKASYAHLGALVVELVRQNDGPLERNIANPEALQPLRDAFAQHRGLIVCTGHAGHWERGGAFLASSGLSRGAIARPLKNPYVDAWLRRVREAGGQRIFDKSGALRHCLRALRDGEGIGIVFDQDAGRRGPFVDFFGRPASTTPTPTRLAVRARAPLATAVLHRDGRPGHFVIRAGPVRWPRPDVEGAEDAETEAMRLLALISADLEALIRQAPEQYLWMHRRWKHAPPPPETESVEKPGEQEHPTLPSE